MPVPHMNAREYTLLMGELKKVFQNACSSFNARVHLLDRGNRKRHSKMAVPHINAREYTLLIGGIEKGIPKCLFLI